MKKFKRIIALLCAAATLAGGVFALSGCNNNSDNDKDSGNTQTPDTNEDGNEETLGKPVAPEGAVDVSLNDIEENYTEAYNKLFDGSRTESESVKLYFKSDVNIIRNLGDLDFKDNIIVEDVVETTNYKTEMNSSYASFGAFDNFMGAFDYKSDESHSNKWNKTFPKEVTDVSSYYQDHNDTGTFNRKSLVKDGKQYVATGWIANSDGEEMTRDMSLKSITQTEGLSNRYAATLFDGYEFYNGALPRYEKFKWAVEYAKLLKDPNAEVEYPSIIVGSSIHNDIDTLKAYTIAYAEGADTHSVEFDYYYENIDEYTIDDLTIEAKYSGSQLYLHCYIKYAYDDEYRKESRKYEDIILIDTNANVTEQNLPLGKIGETKVTAENFCQLTSQDILYVDYDGTPAQLEEKLLAKEPVTLKVLGGGDKTELECTLYINRKEYPLTPDENGEIKITAEMLTGEDEIINLYLNASYGENQYRLVTYYNN